MNTRTLQFSIPVSLILWALIIWACLAFGSAQAAELPLATTAGATGYATEAEAAQAALATAADQSSTLEQAGGIALLGGRYYPTNAVSNNDPGHFAVRIQFAGSLVAIYHTHPGNDGNEDSFSKDDRNVAAGMRVHSYIRSLASGAVYLLSDNRVAQLGGHTLCHGMECRDYYELARHRVAQMYGNERVN